MKMKNQETIKGAIFRSYETIKSSLEKDVNDIQFNVNRLIDEGISEFAMIIQLSAIRNRKYFEDAKDEIYSDVKSVFNYVFRAGSEKDTVKNSNENDKSTDSKNKAIIIYSPLTKNVNVKSYFTDRIEDANIIGKEYVNKNVRNENYTYLINNVISNSDSAISHAATVLSGKLCNSYGVRDRKPKRLWKWRDRLEYLQGIADESNFSEQNKEQIKELKFALQKNNYLKTKRKDIYEKINELLSYQKS
jgi:hypothetical protein